ncbi:hypothetical protein [Nitrososphaera sp.]|uniref:hypothetical protein n=1 Tax=Nitrososphaera sp. TaxID=1971748 RepID=UPI003172836D
MQSTRKVAPIRDSVKSGIVAGQAAAWAIFGVFLAIDSALLTPPGTFYKVIGMALGQGPATDVYVGFVMHMVTATVIGIIYMTISDRVRALYISSVFKGLATGPMTGAVVWAVLFLPLHFGVILPMLQAMAQGATSADFTIAGQLAEISSAQLAARLVELSGTIVAGALAMHILFGCVLGFLGRLGTSSRELLG